MTERERPDWSTFWADYRRDCASVWPEMLAAGREIREAWWETVAMIREDRHWTRRLKQSITGMENPTRRQWRTASRAVLAEAREIEAGERRVLREFGEDAG